MRFKYESQSISKSETKRKLEKLVNGKKDDINSLLNELTLEIQRELYSVNEVILISKLVDEKLCNHNLDISNFVKLCEDFITYRNYLESGRKAHKYVNDWDEGDVFELLLTNKEALRGDLLFKRIYFVKVGQFTYRKCSYPIISVFNCVSTEPLNLESIIENKFIPVGVWDRPYKYNLRLEILSSKDVPYYKLKYVGKTNVHEIHIEDNNITYSFDMIDLKISQNMEIHLNDGLQSLINDVYLYNPRIEWPEGAKITALEKLMQQIKEGQDTINNENG